MFGIKTHILKKLKEKKIWKYGPKLIRINPIGFTCNHNCPMCWRQLVSDKEKIRISKSDLSFKDYSLFIKKLPLSVERIEIVGGGEPLLFPNIKELMKLIKNKKYFSSLITNGSLLNKELSKVLVKIKWDSIRVSFHSASRESYKKVNGVDNFNKVLINIKNFIKIKGNKDRSKIGLLFVIQKDNFFEIKKFVKLAEKLKVDFIEFDYVLGFTSKRLLLTEKEIKQVTKDLKSVKTSIKNNIAEVLYLFLKHPLWNSKIKYKDYFSNRYCHIIQENLEIGSDGNAVLCCLSYDFFQPMKLNINKYSVKTIWEKLEKWRNRIGNGKFENFCYENCNYYLKCRTKKN